MPTQKTLFLWRSFEAVGGFEGHVFGSRPPYSTWTKSSSKVRGLAFPNGQLRCAKLVLPTQTKPEASGMKKDTQLDTCSKL